VKVKRHVIDDVLAHADKDSPVEACGLLLGSAGVIEQAIAMANAEGREDHFTFDGQEQYEVYKTAEKLKMDVIAVYHSHPAAPAWPSSEDIRLAFDPHLLSVIISLMNSKKVVKAFWIRKEEIREEPLFIEE
jgi:[CysO sulfur-carrier protein]-S-L-cysteine hydrolase